MTRRTMLATSASDAGIITRSNSNLSAGGPPPAFRPSVAWDPQFQQQIIASHNEALADGYRRGSPGYYVRLDRAADRLRGGDAHVSAPLLTGDRLDLARSCFMTANPDADGRNDAEVSRWWSRQSHSESAHRMREKWIDYGS
jgi:hypothetical protein